MTIFAGVMVKPPSPETPQFIRQNPKLYPFFKDCIGAVDGSHYESCPPGHLTEVFRNRKGVVTTNVMAAVDFQGRFIHILAGWEGSAHDWKVYMDSVRRGFVIPEGKYLLADAGYNCSHRLLTPYRGIRYHLQESARHGLRPTTPEELYNLRHSQTRIIVEKALGRHKLAFRTLTCRPCYPTTTQVKVIYATAALMNWIIDHGEAESLDIDREIDADMHIDELNNNAAYNGLEEFSRAETDGTDNGVMAQLRRRVNAEMWTQYEEYLQSLESVA